MNVVAQTSPRVVRWAAYHGPLRWSSPVRGRTGAALRGEAYRPAATRAGSVCTGSASPVTPASPSSSRQLGAIHLIVGPMFAGKSSRLLEEAQRLSTVQGDVLYLKSSKDKRYSETHIATHTGVQTPCFAVSHLVRDVLSDERADHDGGESGSDRAPPSTISRRYASSRIVAIDEAQFFGEDLVEFCARAADEDDKTVVVAGLDGDFLRGTFGHVLDLVPLADSIVKLRARCAVCGERAIFSKKIDGDLGRLVELGGVDKYVAVCRLHFKPNDER